MSEHSNPPSLDPVLEHDAPDRPDRPGVRHTGLVRVLAVVVAVAMAAGAVVLAAGGDDRDADETLTAVKGTLEERPSYRFEIETTESIRTGTDDGPGSATTTRTVTTGEIASPDQWRLASDDGEGWREETVRVGDAVYYRYLSDFGGRDTWIVEEAGDFDRGLVDDLGDELRWMNDSASTDPETQGWQAAARSSARIAIVTTGHLLESRTDPERLTRLVLDAEDPEIIERGSDGRTMRATVPPPADLAGLAGEPLPTAEVEIEHDADDRPSTVRLDLAENGVEVELVIRFSDWGAPISIEAPDEKSIDRTPWVDEDDLRDAAPELLVVPTQVPAGLSLQGATIGGRGARGCELVNLDYGPVIDPGATPEEAVALYEQGSYLWINAYRRGCEEALTVGGGEPFDEELGGLPAHHDFGWVVLVGSVVVSLDSDLDDDALAAVAASLSRTDVEALIASVERPIVR